MATDDLTVWVRYTRINFPTQGLRPRTPQVRVGTRVGTLVGRARDAGVVRFPGDGLMGTRVPYDDIEVRMGDVLW